MPRSTVWYENGCSHHQELPDPLRSAPQGHGGRRSPEGRAAHRGPCLSAGYPGHPGPRGYPELLISEVQKVYRLQGVDINDKHIEVIVLSDDGARSASRDAGSSDFIVGSVVNRREVMIKNEEIQERIDAGETDLKLVQASQVLLGNHQVQPGYPDSFPVRCVLPGDHQCPDRGRYQGQDRPAGRPEGERHHRQTGFLPVPVCRRWRRNWRKRRFARDAAESAYDH